VSSNDTNEAEPVVDRATLAAFRETVGDPEAVRDILTTYVEQSARLETELARRADAGDAAGAARIAHTLRSSALLVGARRLADVCSSLEAVRSAEDPAFAALAAELLRESRGVCDVLRAEQERDD
jgi:HPt (histidine-containing phosphotransfer) domain-containing protein